MKTLKSFILTLSLTMASFSFSQEKETKITSLEITKDNKVALTIESSEQFYIGAQDYHLYVGDTYIKNPRYVSKDDSFYLIFTISPETYAKMPANGESMLCYGRKRLDKKGKLIPESVTYLNNFRKDMLKTK